MISWKDLLALIIALVVLAFSRSFLDRSLFLNSLLIFGIILLVYTLAKKAMAYYLEAEEETKIWTFQRFGFGEVMYVKTPIPIGIILAFILPIITLGNAFWLAVLESDVKPLSSRVAKKHDIYSFSEMTEWHLGLISAAGVIAMFALSIIAYLFDFPDLARFSIYYACFNLLPLGKLDGTRILFGSRKAVLWITLALIALIGLFYSFML